MIWDDVGNVDEKVLEEAIDCAFDELLDDCILLSASKDHTQAQAQTKQNKKQQRCKIPAYTMVAEGTLVYVECVANY